MGVAESDSNDAEQDTDVDSGGSLWHGDTEMMDKDKKMNVDADEFSDDYGGHGRVAERTRKRRRLQRTRKQRRLRRTRTSG